MQISGDSMLPHRTANASTARTTDAKLAFVDLAAGDETRPRIRCHTTPFGVFVDPESPPGAMRFVTTTWLAPQQLTLWTVDATSSQCIDLEVKPELDPGDIAFSRHHGQRVIAGGGSYANIHVWTTETGRLQYAT